MKRFLIIAVLSVIAMAAVADEEKITVSFNNTNIIDVIRWASDLTKKTIIVNEGVKNKTVTVMPGPPMTKAEAYQVFLSILQVNGLAVVETEDSLKIFTAPEAKTMAIPMLSDGKSSPDDVVVSIIKIKNVAASQLANLLRPLVPASANLAPHDDTNILLVADNKANIEKIMRLVEQIDKAGNIDIEVIPLKYASAKEVASLVSSLVPKVVAGAPGNQSGAAQSLSLAADERSNSILMNGDPVLRSQMKSVIEKLDQPLAGVGNTQVIYLNYADAKDLEKILSSVGGSVANAEKDPKATGSPSKDVSIVASEANNALIVTAPPSVLNTIKEVIQELDIRRQQVLVEVLLVEVNEDAGRQLGLFWQNDPHGSGGTEVGGKFDPGSGLPAIPMVDSTGASVPAGLANTGGLIAAYFREGNLRGVISALGSLDSANILSTPTIIALDNEDAEILVGENVPFRTGVQNLGTTTTTPTAGSTTAPVEANLFEQIQRQDVGIHLKVKPKINQNGTLTLEIDQTVEAVKTTSDVAQAADIVTSKRQVKTKALVGDNQILALGGLITDSSSSSESKVPFLGDIPIIGWLFKGTKKNTSKQNLMVFIHPKILHTDEDNQRVSYDKYKRMQELQERFNKHADWLTIHSGSMPKLDNVPEATPGDGSVTVKDSIPATSSPAAAP